LQTAYNIRFSNLNLVNIMCEFNVIFNGKTQFKDVVYAKIEGKNVIVKNVLGESKEFKNCIITEVDVNSTKMVLTASKS
jgi:predicted RNA-binding protein